jgi:hypothetical protein
MAKIFPWHDWGHLKTLWHIRSVHKLSRICRVVIKSWVSACLYWLANNSNTSQKMYCLWGDVFHDICTHKAGMIMIMIFIAHSVQSIFTENVFPNRYPAFLVSVKRKLSCSIAKQRHCWRVNQSVSSNFQTHTVVKSVKQCSWNSVVRRTGCWRHSHWTVWSLLWHRFGRWWTWMDASKKAVVLWGRVLILVSILNALLWLKRSLTLDTFDFSQFILLHYNHNRRYHQHLWGPRFYSQSGLRNSLGFFTKKVS